MSVIVNKEQNAIFKLEEKEAFKQKAFNWTTRFDVLAYLDSNDYPEQIGKGQDCLIAVGMESQLLVKQDDTCDAFTQLQNFYEQKKDWLFGFLTYDLKNDVEKLSSKNYDGLAFPKLHFFQPRYVLKITKNKVEIISKKEPAHQILEQILATPLRPLLSNIFPKKPQLEARISKTDYLKTIHKIHDHLRKGDIYEMNFCQEFYVEDLYLVPASLFEKFNKISKAPFSTFYRFCLLYTSPSPRD